MTVMHGGRLDEAIARFGGAQKSWLDLSTGINPNAYSVADIEAIAWCHLPQNSDLELLLHDARTAYAAPKDAPCIAAAGTQAIIQTLPGLFKPQSVAIVGFTYQEHGLCWQRAGHEVLVADGLESAEASARIIIVVNPNNPDGRAIEPSQLVELAKRLGAKGGLLVVDEAFCDTMPELSVLANTGQAGLLVLRSFGKYFGLAGLRLGFAFGPSLVIQRLGERLGPWPVSGPAILIGREALQNKKWITGTRRKLKKNRIAFEQLLSNSTIEIIGATDLFVLIQLDKATELYEHLAMHKILTRPFPGREDWLRIGIPGKKASLTRFSKALAEFIK